MRSSFFPKENLNRPNYIFPHHILILFIHCILLSREILHIPKITPPNGKNALRFLKNIFACTRVKTSLRSAYLLQSEFRMIMGTLNVRDMVTFSAWYPRKGHTYLNLQLKDTWDLRIFSNIYDGAFRGND